MADAGPDAKADPLETILTVAERVAVRGLSPLPAVPSDPTNLYADNAAAAGLGKKFFFDKRFSGALAIADDGNNGAVGAMGDIGKLSCASCHLGPALDDRRSKPGNVSLGSDFLGRNSPAIVNSSYYTWTNWGGRFAAQWELPIVVVEAGKNMNGNRLNVAHVIYDNYKTEYEAVFGTLNVVIATLPANGKPKAMGAVDGPWEGVPVENQLIVNRVLVNFSKALQAYMRTLVRKDAALDKLVAGDKTALSPEALRGLKLFVGKAACISCHSGPSLTDNRFHNIGVGQTGPKVPPMDLGRFTDIPSLLGSSMNVNSMWSDNTTTGRLAGLTSPAAEETRGQFRTPTLRQVAETAPYMHAGQLATLEDVVSYYSRGGDVPAAGVKDVAMTPLNLTATEQADLVAFLKALNGAALPAGLATP